MNLHLPVENLQSPGTFFTKLYERVPKYIRLTFCSAVILGFLTHVYMLTHKFANHDDLGALFGSDYGTASGRWFLPYSLQLDGDFSMPWLIGVVSIFFIALSACLVVSLLRIRNPVGCILTSAVMIAFPTVAGTLAYMFTASSYFLSLLLAAFGAWIAYKHGWWGSAVAVVAITLSIGIYQSYFSVAAVLMVGAMLAETLDGERNFRSLLVKGLRLVATLAVSMVAYMIIVRITTRETGLVNYLGMQEMGHIELKELPGLIRKSYESYFDLFLHNEKNFHFNFLKYAFALTGLGTVVLGVMILIKRRLGIIRTVLALVLAIIYPLAGNLVYIMAPQAGGAHDLMIYGMSFVLILPVFLMEYAGDVFREKSFWCSRLLYAVVSWVIVLTVALTAYSHIIFDNSAYLKIDVSMKQCEAYSNRLIERIESCEGYEPGMNVVLVGSNRANELQFPTPEVDSVQLTGIFDMSALCRSYTYHLFLRYYCGYTGAITLNGVADTEQIQSMPCYPRDGSIQVIDGRVIVKLNN